MLMSQEEQENLNIKEAFDKQEKENILEEPIPKNNFCYICHIKFEDYLLHLETKTHKKNLNEENIYFNKEIKNAFKRVNKFWDNNNDNSDMYDGDSSESNMDQSEDLIKSESEENNINNIDNNISLKIPILTSSVISLVNEDIKKEENIEGNKENINVNENINKIIFEKIKYNYGNNFNLKDNNNNIFKNNNKRVNFSKFKLLKKKRITFDVIRYDGNNNNSEFKREYFSYLNKYKTRKFVGNSNVLFK